jgi:flagella basal body P-ring formation protein FlgA
MKPTLFSFSAFNVAMMAVGLMSVLAASPAQSAEAEVRNIEWQAPPSIAAAARALLHSELAAVPGAAGTPSIVMAPTRKIKYPRCDAMTASLPKNSKPRSRMTVIVRCTAPQNWTTTIQANVKLPIRYFVAADTLVPGQIISTDNLRAQTGELGSVPAGAATNAASLIGMQAATRIGAGRPVLPGQLRKGGSVTRGQNVRIVARGKGFKISNHGEALGSGAPGTPIQVRTASGQTVTGIVGSAGDVDISIRS